MLDRILQVYHASDYDFRRIANPADPMAYRFPAWVNYYRLKWAIAQVLQPQTILEIGVRYGYAAHAFLSAMPQSHYTGIDLDCELAGGVPGAINWARDILQSFNAELVVADSQAMEQFPGDRYDLIHVDGQQDGDSSFHDLQLALHQARYILVDGYHWTPLNYAAVNDFLFQQRDRLEWSAAIPGYAGELLIKPRSQTPAATHQTSHDLQSAYNSTYYTESCHGYDSFTRYKGQRLEDERLMGAATIASLKPTGHVLDLGCGRGELAFHLAQRGYQVTAIDYSEAAIRIAQDCCCHHPDWRAQVDFHCADVNQVVLPAAHYDLVIATDLIEHLNPEEVAQLYDRIGQWLKPDGIAIFHTFPNRWYYDYDYKRKRRLAKRLGAYLPQDPRSDYERLMHINEQSPRVLRRQLRAAFAHSQIWFATPGPQGLGGSLLTAFTHRQMAAAPSLYAIASHQPLPQESLRALLQTTAIGRLEQRQLGQAIQVKLQNPPASVGPDQVFEIATTLVNRSKRILHSRGAYPMHLSYRWLDETGKSVSDHSHRTPIFPPALAVTPQPTIPYYVKVTAPSKPGRYTLQVLPVQENVRWLEQCCDQVVMQVHATAD